MPQLRVDGRYYLTGIYLHQIDGQLAAVATDGHRLARVTTAIEVGVWQGIIIPRKFCEQLVRLGAVTVRASDKIIEAGAGTTTLASKLIDGTYPDYIRLLTPQTDASDVDRAELVAAIARLNALAITKLDKRVVHATVRITWRSDDRAIRLALHRQREDADDLVEANITAASARRVLVAIALSKRARQHAAGGAHPF